MNGYAQGFNISSEEIAVFVSVARKAADILNFSLLSGNINHLKNGSGYNDIKSA